MGCSPPCALVRSQGVLLSVLLSTPALPTRKRPGRAAFVSKNLEATVGIEPTIGVLQTPALTTWPRRPCAAGAEEGI